MATRRKSASPPPVDAEESTPALPPRSRHEVPNHRYDEAIVQRIIHAIQLGAPAKYAAAYGGIAESTFYLWMKERPDFAQQVLKARADTMVTRLVRIRQAEAESWQASAWYLEKQFPQEFGRMVQEHHIFGLDSQQQSTTNDSAVRMDRLQAAAAKLGVDGLRMLRDLRNLLAVAVAEPNGEDTVFDTTFTT